MPALGRSEAREPSPPVPAPRQERARRHTRGLSPDRAAQPGVLQRLCQFAFTDRALRRARDPVRARPRAQAPRKQLRVGFASAVTDVAPSERRRDEPRRSCVRITGTGHFRQSGKRAAKEGAQEWTKKTAFIAPVTDASLADGPTSDSGDDAGGSASGGTGKWPDFACMSVGPRPVPSRGKYGDPGDPEEWAWFVEQGRWEQRACDTRLACTSRVNPESKAATLALREARSQAGTTATSSDGQYDSGTTQASVLSERADRTFPVKMADGRVAKLHVPQAQMKHWDVAADGSVRLRKHGQEYSGVRMPVLTPSSDRAASALLDLSDAMVSPGGTPVDYVQVIAVRGSECEAYRSRRATYAVLELPELPRAVLRLRDGSEEAAEAARSAPYLPRSQLSAYVVEDDHGKIFGASAVVSSSVGTVTVEEYRGVGESRSCLKQFADAACRPSWPYVFMLDDNVKKWWGVTLPDDPCPLFGVPASSVAQRHPQPLASVLRYWENFEGLSKFAGVGFPRWRPAQIDVRCPFQTAFLYSAVILNLERLRGVDYNPALPKWEDIDFQRRAQEAGGVFVRANRWIQMKVKLGSGGCAKLVTKYRHRHQTGGEEEGTACKPIAPASGKAGETAAAKESNAAPAGARKALVRFEENRQPQRPHHRRRASSGGGWGKDKVKLIRFRTEERLVTFEEEKRQRCVLKLGASVVNGRARVSCTNCGWTCDAATFGDTCRLCHADLTDIAAVELGSLRTVGDSGSDTDDSSAFGCVPQQEEEPLRPVAKRRRILCN